MVTKTGATPLTMAGVRGEYFARLSAQMEASTHRLVASVFDTNQPSEDYPWLHESKTLTKWEGERTIQRLKGEKIVLVNDEYETTIAFRKRDFIRDKTPQMQARVQDMAQNVAVFPTQLMTELLTANGNAYDNKAFFATDHKIGDSGTINNARTFTIAAAVPTVAETSDVILSLLEAILSFKNAGGQPMNEAAKEFAIMCPPGLFGRMVAAINASFTANGATNPLGEMMAVGYRFVPVINARLTGTSTFYLMRTDAGIRPFIVQEEDTVPVELGVDSEHCKKTNEVVFGHGWSGAVGYGRFELAIRAVMST